VIGDAQGDKRSERWDAHARAKRNDRDRGKEHPRGGGECHACETERHAEETEEGKVALAKTRL